MCTVRLTGSRAVGRGPSPAAQAADRGDDDQVSAALPLEKAVGPTDRSRPAHNIGADGRFLQRIVQPGVQLACPGAHHAQIHTAQLPGEGIQRGARGRQIGDIGLGAAEGAGIGGGQFIQQRPAPSGHADAVSGGGEAFGHRAADAGGGPYDNRSFHRGKVSVRKREKD